MMSHTRVNLGLAGLLLVIAYAGSAGAQEAADERVQVLSTVSAALDALSDEDMVAFTDHMVEETVMFRVAERDGRVECAARNRADSRANRPSIDIVERGFDPEIRISGPMAMVWLPYDLYLDGEWSHCGVDAFVLMKIEGVWKIASLSWTVEQPPACRRHPDGPRSGR
jgi:hypothetical protein